MSIVQSGRLAEVGAEAWVARSVGAIALLARVEDALARAGADQSLVPGRFDLSGFSADELALIDEVLGAGEVSAEVAGPSPAIARESSMAGLWRVTERAGDGRTTADYLEIADVPAVVRRAVETGTRDDLEFGAAPEGAMNVMPVLTEIRARRTDHRAGQANHVINFSLLPMTPADMAYLESVLGLGPVRILSKGYGTCRIAAAACRGVWLVRFLNVMDTVILDTLEIGDVPAAALAAVEDFQDSAARLAEIRKAYLA